ncbi:M20/M25/M40 family metallo-hydrolase [Lacihabitans sp. LS3-19]|uniref:M20/M25/M40 family metallo-hydrolase n=1 Tax=Lacihabitans sp. LS3-19 TaxID=2487335 RepID=UPI0020CEDB48|nr:M20/M25/M40 family metallo-hydrolase [Lacihabitans sp. LS3-19]MCP9767116.1 M20/M25/M40 family metallo-hydrolase [Lacihabitans sp. LS3-19]
MKNLPVFFLLLLFPIFLKAQDVKKVTVQEAYKKEIETVANSKKVQKAFDVIQSLEPQTMKDLIELTEIPAPPFMEQKRGERFMEMVKSAGADSIWIDEVGNVIALRKGKTKGKTVVLEAHLDTVFPIETDVKVKMHGDTLYAPGIGDDTRGLSMVITIMKAMKSAQINTNADVLFVGVVGEEGLGDLRGVKHLFKNGNRKIDAYIAIDGGDIGRINNMALGSLRYKVTFNGPGGHSWGAFGMANPHHAIGKAIDYFDQAAGAYVANGPKTSYNVGRIGGGTSVNSIPFESWMEIDMRSVSPEKLLGIESIMKEQMQRALEDYNKTVKKGDKLTVNIEKIGERPSGELGENLPLILKAIAVTSYFNAQPTLTRGSTDSNIPIALGVPAITIGRGGKAGNAHALDEWYLNDESGALAIKLALLILVSEAGLAN